VRYINQHLHEHYLFQGDPNNTMFDTNMPRAEMIDPGVFVELTLPVDNDWSIRGGGRADWVHTTADADEVRANTSLAGGTSNLSQNDVLYAFYIANDFDISPNWDGRIAMGHAQRVPSLTQRYADGLFLGIIQDGFSRVIGDPGLRKERAWQLDLTLEAEYDWWRGRAAAFHSWILDYATYQANVITDPAGARLLISTNTDLATLTGFELYGEADLTEMITLFAALRYLDGRDRQIDAPLPTIIPMESRAGLRLQDSYDDPVWGLELGLRIVDNQDRIGALRTVGVPNVLTTVEQATPGFTTCYIRGFYNWSQDLNFVAGVDNLFDRTYIEHLDLRLPAGNGFVESPVLSPGITPYIGLEWRR
jgi:outer membrane receptor protein involved in Fe transport